jgi:GTP-binding protein SAR1
MSIIFDYFVNSFTKIMYKFGLLNKKATILMLGLDNSGKTTLTRLLLDDKLSVNEPTKHPQTNEVTIGNLTMKCFDMGGHAAARRLWKQYMNNIDAIIYLIDVSDSIRLEESISELNKIINNENINVPILVFANKIDKNTQYLCNNINYIKDILSKQNNMTLFNCSIVKRTGLSEGFKWLENKI